MIDPVVPVSWGELLDKVAILEIKRLRLRSAEAVMNAERELAALAPALDALQPVPTGLAELRSALAAVNQRLWTIEDRIREREAAGDFGPNSWRWRDRFTGRTTSGGGSNGRSIRCWARAWWRRSSIARIDPGRRATTKITHSAASRKFAAAGSRVSDRSPIVAYAFSAAIRPTPSHPGGPQQRINPLSEQRVVASHPLRRLPAAEIGQEVAGANSAALRDDLLGHAFRRPGDELLVTNREIVRRPRGVG